MASTALGKLQGQGLIETTTAGLQQTGAQLATTPMGATMQGRTPSSVKMAGTQPSKVNALATGMQDVSSVALAGLRETSRIMEGTDAEKALADRAQQATPLGRVDDALSKKATEILNAKLKALKFEGADLDIDKLKSVGMKQDEIDALQTSINDLSTGGVNLTQSDINTINAALIEVGVDERDLLSWDGDTAPSAYAMATAIAQLFTEKSSEELQGILSQAILDSRNESTINNLDDSAVDAIFDTPNKVETKSDLIRLLADLTGQSEVQVAAMKLEDVREALATWKEKEFKDVAKLRETLQSKDASYAQRQLALKELRRLGQIGITAAAEKAGDLEKQIQEGDIVRIGDQEWTYEEIFADPAKLQQLATWIDNPEEAPAELRTWLTQNKDAISLKITDLLGDTTTGLAGATARVTENKQTVALPAGTVIGSATYEAFFPGWDKGSIDPYSIFLGATAVAEEQKIGDAAVAKAEKALKEGETLSEEDKAKIRQDALNADPEYVKAQKYKLLQDGTYGKNTALLLTGLTGLGQEGKDIFKELTVAEIQELSLSDAGVNRFLTGITNRRNAAAFSGATNLKQEFKDTMSALGLGSTAALFANLEGVDLKEFADIFKEAGLSGYLAGNKFALSKLTDQIKELGKMSASDLVRGKNRTIIDNLSSLHAKLTAEFGRVGMREEKLLKPSERDAQFAQSEEAGEYTQTVEQRRQKTERDLRDARVDEDYANSKKDYWQGEEPRSFLGSQYKRNQLADGQISISGKGRGWSEWDGVMKQRHGEYNAAKAKREALERQLSDIPQYAAERQSRYDKWWQKYEEGLGDRNEALRKRYDKLQSLFTTGVAA